MYYNLVVLEYRKVHHNSPGQLETSYIDHRLESQSFSSRVVYPLKRILSKISQNNIRHDL